MVIDGMLIRISVYNGIDGNVDVQQLSMLYAYISLYCDGISIGR